MSEASENARHCSICYVFYVVNLALYWTLSDSQVHKLII